MVRPPAGFQTVMIRQQCGVMTLMVLPAHPVMLELLTSPVAPVTQAVNLRQIP
jgi:hypothetical protein